MEWHIKLLSIGLILAQLTCFINGSDTYTERDKKAIAELRPRVEKYLTLDYMKEDKFLLRFLRARGHNVNQAAQMMKENYEWRKENNVDNILKEDWTKWEKLLPFHLIVDREGRPALVSAIGSVDFRRVFLSGYKNEFTRYLDYAFEKGVTNLHVVSNATGKEWIDGFLLFDLSGFNWREHACVYCIPIWIDLISHYETYFPVAVQKIIVINTPRIFTNLVQILKPFLTATTATALEIYGVDKAEWKKVLLKMFPEKELPFQFGGTRKIHSHASNTNNNNNNIKNG